MRYYLGIDGGGTHTRALLVTPEGRVIGAGEGGPSNYHNVGADVAAANLRRAAEQAWSVSGNMLQPAAYAFIGSAGIKSASDIAQLTHVAEKAGLAAPGDIRVANDLENALAGGLKGRPGIALIAGTGTNCLGRDSSGAAFMCGGWGWLLDDEGGGAGISIAAMRCVARAADGRGPATAMLPALLAFLGLTEPNELLERLYVKEWTADQLAAFTPVVVRLADQGDNTARAVLKSGAKSLASLVRGACSKLNFPSGPEVVILGGCARSGPPYQTMIEEAIRTAVPSARLIEPELSPVEGAALNALRYGHIGPMPDAIFKTR